MQPALAPRINNTAQDHVSDQILRDQLLAQNNNDQQGQVHPDVMQQSDNPSPNDHSGPEAMAGNDTSMNPESGDDIGDGSGDGRKGYGKRELSTSKRAAQNRAAQRAFRQRKEGYIKKLEEQVRDYALLNENFKTIQAENYQLRDYIISLQSRLLESHGEVPSPPNNVEGLEPGKSRIPQMSMQPVQGQSGLPSLGEMRNMPQSSNIQPDLQTVGQPQPPQPSYRPTESPANKRTRTEMDSAQSALQNPSILNSPNAQQRR